MLRQRVITALVLLVVILACLFAPAAWPFVLLVTLILATAMWEWSRLNGLGGLPAWLLGGGFALCCLAGASTGMLHGNGPIWLWLIFSLAWLVAAVRVLRGGVAGWSALPRILRLVCGAVVLALVWLAVLKAFNLGINYLLSLMALVWAADIGAYFAGRMLGQKLVSRKLAPSVSPGKSWEGVFGGMVAVLLLATLWLYADDWLVRDWGRSFYGVVYNQGPLALVLVCVLLAGMSVLGDLLESLVKRAAGVKDSSAVLPGHGGVLDRIDGMVPVMPAGMLVLSLLVHGAAAGGALS